MLRALNICPQILLGLVVLKGMSRATSRNAFSRCRLCSIVVVAEEGVDNAWVDEVDDEVHVFGCTVTCNDAVCQKLL